MYHRAVPKITESQREARRRAFLAAALECLRNQSYRDVTVDTICALAGTSKGSFYLYFASKKELLLALLDEQAAAFEQQIGRLERRSDSSAAFLRAFAHSQFRRVRDPANVQLHADLWGLAATEPDIGARLAEVNARQRTLLAGWIERSIEQGAIPLDPALAHAFAAALLALTEGLVVHRSLDPAAFHWTRIGTLLDTALTAIE